MDDLLMSERMLGAETDQRKAQELIDHVLHEVLRLRVHHWIHFLVHARFALDYPLIRYPKACFSSLAPSEDPT